MPEASGMGPITRAKVIPLLHWGYFAVTNRKGLKSVGEGHMIKFCIGSLFRNLSGPILHSE
jgi:hypothetical protein